MTRAFSAVVKLLVFFDMSVVCPTVFEKTRQNMRKAQFISLSDKCVGVQVKL